MHAIWLIVMVLGVGFLGWRGLLVFAEARRWPEPIEMPFWCARCRHGFRTDALYVMHVNHQHDERYGPLKAQLDELKGKGTGVKVDLPKPARAKRKPRAKPKAKLKLV